MCLSKIIKSVSFYPRDVRSKSGTCYGNVAAWLAGWVDGWLAGCHMPVLHQNSKTYLKTFSTIW